MAAIREAAQDGTIQQPEKRRQLVRRYAAGLDPLRHDVYPDFNHPSHPTAIENRGEYWMAPQFVRFFREWLDYSGADTSFKDTPTATSPYETAPYGDEGFHDLQARAVGPDEALLAEHLDDTIARIVVETDIGTGDVFTELMTSRQWHVPATGDYTTDCTTGCTQVGFGCSHFGDCRNVNGRADAALPLAFGIETPIPKTRAARWATVSASERLGVLTHPAWLAAHGGNFEDDASLVLRGKWLREHLLCQTVGALSMVQVEAQLGPSAPDLSARERVAAAMKTECMACHSLMNSLGVSFELYNHAGFIRDNDHGGPPDGSTDIDNIPTHFGENLNGTYDSPLALVQALATARLARVSFVRHAFRFFMGRDETLADACTLVEMENALDETGSFVVMVEALVASDTFAYRHSEN